MTRTIKLSDEGGVSFDSNGMLEMVGRENEISLDEVKQRMSIRFYTQKRFNVLYPAEGFDMIMLSELKKSAGSYAISPAAYIEQELRAVLMQDRDIQHENAEIEVSGPDSDRRYTAKVIYMLRGTFKDRIEFMGTMGSF